MIRTWLWKPGTNTILRGGPELVTQWLTDTQTTIWVDIAKHDSEAERALLRSSFGLHALAVDDALRDRHPPKIECFNNATFVLLRGLFAQVEGVDFNVIQLALFVGERFLVTRHNRNSTSIDWLERKLEEDPSALGGPAALLAARVMNRMVQRYLEILLGLEPRLEELEALVFQKPDDTLLYELTHYKSRLREIRRIASYHLQIATELREGQVPFFDADLTHELNDFYEQLERTASLAGLYYETASDLIEGYLALASHRLNRVMQILTIFTVVFVPITFIAGIYGMNFVNMPELHSTVGYYVVLGVMFVLVALQLFYFRRRGWL